MLGHHKALGGPGTTALFQGHPPLNLYYRSLQHSDYDALKAIHHDLFPIDYEEVFFRKAVSGEDRVFSWAAVHSEYGRDHLVGFVTARLVYMHECDPVDRQVMGLSGRCLDRHSAVYVLTLGVVAGCRQGGIARSLLGLVHQHATSMRCRAVFLHVISYNDAAMRLYGNAGYQPMARLPHFYHLMTGRQPNPQQSWYDAFLYALFLPPGCLGPGGAGGVEASPALQWAGGVLGAAVAPLRSVLGTLNGCMPTWLCRQTVSTLLPFAAGAAPFTPAKGAACSSTATHAPYPTATAAAYPQHPLAGVQQPHAGYTQPCGSPRPGAPSGADQYPFYPPPQHPQQQGPQPGPQHPQDWGPRQPPSQAARVPPPNSGAAAQQQQQQQSFEAGRMAAAGAAAGASCRPGSGSSGSGSGTTAAAPGCGSGASSSSRARAGSGSGSGAGAVGGPADSVGLSSSAASWEPQQQQQQQQPQQAASCSGAAVGGGSGSGAAAGSGGMDWSQGSSSQPPQGLTLQQQQQQQPWYWVQGAQQQPAAEGGGMVLLHPPSPLLPPSHAAPVYAAAVASGGAGHPQYYVTHYPQQYPQPQHQQPHQQQQLQQPQFQLQQQQAYDCRQRHGHGGPYRNNGNGNGNGNYHNQINHQQQESYSPLPYGQSSRQGDSGIPRNPQGLGGLGLRPQGSQQQQQRQAGSLLTTLLRSPAAQPHQHDR